MNIYAHIFYFLMKEWDLYNYFPKFSPMQGSVIEKGHFKTEHRQLTEFAAKKGRLPLAVTSSASSALQAIG